MNVPWLCVRSPSNLLQEEHVLLEVTILQKPCLDEVTVLAWFGFFIFVIGIFCLLVFVLFYLLFVVPFYFVPTFSFIVHH